MKTIYLIRHGETQANRDGVFRGRGEVPLSPAGLRQARELGAKWFWKFHLDNASVSVLLHEPVRGSVLAKLNETEHLSQHVFEWD